MKNSLLLNIVFFVTGFYAASFFNCNNNNSLKSENILIQGTPDSTYITGRTISKDSILSFTWITSATTTPSFTPDSPESGAERDKEVYTKSFSNDYITAKVEVFTYPPVDSVLINLFADIVHKSYERIDTLIINRVDTLSITHTIELEPPFYNTALFGASVTALIILIINLILK